MKMENTKMNVANYSVVMLGATGAVGGHILQELKTNSSSLYFRTKGELVRELKALNFERLSIFQPSLIQTPTNRYGFSQAVALFIFPYLKSILLGRLRKYRGIPVEKLGKAIAVNIFNNNEGFETLHWGEFNNLTKSLTNN